MPDIEQSIPEFDEKRYPILAQELQRTIPSSKRGNNAQDLLEVLIILESDECVSVDGNSDLVVINLNSSTAGVAEAQTFFEDTFELCKYLPRIQCGINFRNLSDLLVTLNYPCERYFYSTELRKSEAIQQN